MVNSQSQVLISTGQRVNLSSEIDLTDSLTVLHFYDPTCVLARDNIEHLQVLVDRYEGRKVRWFIVHAHEVDFQLHQRKLGFEAEWVEDFDRKLATALGVINTPKLVILDDQKLYYRGTYSKNGALCGADNIESSDAGLAYSSSVKGNQLPLFLKETGSYVGCAL